MNEYSNNIKNVPEDDFFNSFDPNKFLVVLRKSSLWCIGFFLITISAAYLYIRYTKPLFESDSVLKLDFQSEAKTLGLANMETVDLSEISGEMEILKSKLFFNQVVEQVEMDVSYYYYGTYLVDERYKNNPFVVSYLIKDPAFYNKDIDLSIIGSQEFELDYFFGGQQFTTKHTFGEEIQTPYFNFRIDKTSFFSYPEVSGKYFFRVNSKDQLIKYLQQNVDVRPENFNAKTIRIAVTDYSKLKARDLVWAIDTLYLQYSRETKIETIEKKISFLDSQIDETERRLEDFEDYFEDFTIKNRTVNLENDLAKTIQQLDYLDSARFNKQIRLSDAKLLKERIQSEEPLLINPIFLEKMPSTLSENIKLYEEILNNRSLKLSSYNENTHVIQQIDKQLVVLESDIVKSVDEYIDDIEAEITSLVRRRASLENNFVELPSMGTEYNKNKRFYALQEEFLLSLRQSKMELEITRAGTVTNFVVLSPASFPDSPVKPEPILIYGLGFSIGFMLSFGFILIRYLIHNKVNGLKELERLISVPIIGAVPNYSGEKLPLTRLVVETGSKSPLSEALRTIRTNMEFMNGTKDKHLITITSTISGEGKTFVAVNLGAIISFANQKVCIVDLDMRKPKVHSAFGNNSSSSGMSTLLIGKSSIEECIQKTEIDGLDYIPAGPIPPNPSELILNKEYDKILESLLNTYDTVILDTPPVGLVTDAILSMKKSDLQLYVVRSDYSKRSFLKMIDNLKNVNKFEKLTVIFNGLKHNGREGYGYGYGYGYTNHK